ncbi:MAG: bifunctional diaminohydroxyphosphoribosylaminopyrimidine deaminase/5-amino-6-(5-phosphoribosylamino)uracil reductase RibD [Clostridium sp.]|nr:bifunctional diaminohydroxyphosphoribosylaminopyrimidine deaminase/5-amino-6-(5-phosphoribosylamino)uracil reductase RibD [Clostridium sp.]MCM1208132.1 bifunctional diaminohydroxyphosphoribosylaminopyrimidine deaminase/5-amino-6-(5-phosphoribosylamino)uracil reductase RibD [Ruminococcus sp.]
MFEEQYMQRAITLAKKGIGAVNPNPLVGAVIVKEGRIIGEGYHAGYGGLHAERAAFANLTEDAKGAELYVTLEPCCHFGKQPPCTEAIVSHGISHVYVGSDDPNERVCGKGISYLREHGVVVDTQMMKEECDKLNDVFFHYITTNTPYVVMKYAMTLDGKIATRSGKSKWITGETARHRVAESRNEYTGIMAGIGTVLADDPMLTCRLDGGRNPIRIICDSSLRIPLDSNIVKTARDVRTIVVASDECKDIKKAEQLSGYGIEVISVGKNADGLDLKALMIKLGEKGIDGILLEGGGTLNYSALAAGIVNELNVYIAPKIFGGASALSPVEGMGVESPGDAEKFILKRMEQLEEDILLVYKKQT